MRKLFVQFALYILKPKKVIHSTIYDRGDMDIRFTNEPTRIIIEGKIINNVPAEVTAILKVLREERAYYKQHYINNLIKNDR